jgi:hypothetical protein
MANTYETLQYVDSTGSTQEVALSVADVAAAPAARILIEPASHAPGKCTITWPQRPETGVAIPFKSRCVVYANRASASGAANSFSAGSPVFIGRRTDNPASAAPDRFSTTIILEDFLWDLAKITYQQAANEISGGTLASPTYTPFYWPDVVLFQSFAGVTYTPPAEMGTITTWQQIQDILNYALAYATGANAVQFQFSTAAEFTPVYRNWYPMRGPKCLEAILNCLRTHPGVYTEVDYTTTDGGGHPLPTIHFRNRGSMTALTLPYASTDANGVLHQATDIQPLPELIPDNVRLYYRINSTFNGQPIASPATDCYPSNSNSLLNQDFSIDITGASQTETIKNFTSSVFNPTSLALWRQKVAALHQVSQGGQIPNDGSTGALAFVSTAAYNAGSNPKGIQVLSDDGNDYSASYGSTFGYLTDDEIMTWFALASGSLNVMKCTVKAYFSYNKTSTIAGSTVTDQVQEHQHTFRTVLCSIPSGQYILKQVVNAGEAIPSGLAQALWTEQQTLQYKMTHKVFQVAANNTSLPTLVKPGKHMINLSGGATAWTTMNAVPQRVQIQLMRVFVAGVATLAAQTSISCGPVNHLNPDELIQLANVFRNRDRARIDPNARLSGGTSSTQVDLSLTAGSKENSLAANPIPTTMNFVGADATAAGLTNLITHDATVGQITRVQQYGGSVIATGYIAPVYSGSGSPSSTSLPANAYYRLFDRYIDSTTHNEWLCNGAGNNDVGGSGGSTWVQIGGGGMDWQSPKELDPTVAVAAGTFVYVSPKNPLVTTGLVDLVLGTLTTARPGIWQAVQAVSAKTTAGKYNVPQVPLPGAGSAPSGSPLKGDADGTNVFWIPWCPTVYC